MPFGKRASVASEVLKGQWGVECSSLSRAACGMKPEPLQDTVFLKITVVMLDFFQEDSIEILYIGSMG